MKNFTKLVQLILLTFFFNSLMAQRDYVNREWGNTTGTVGTIDRTASVLDNNENLIVVSNTINSSSNTDVLLTKYDPEGTIIWQKTYDGSANGNDYGVQLKVNDLNEIFVACAIEGASSVDFGVLKYAPDGTLDWSNTWNNSANGMDIPADIDLDDNGDIYIVGGAEASNNLSDYAILKFDNNGIFEWSVTYDYANLHDAATSLKFNSGNVIVTGTSASSTSEWDFATLKIDAGNGVILNTERTVVAGVGLDNAQAVTTDDNNNIYITGYVEVNGNSNIQTVKLDANFNLLWVKNFDGGLEDVARAIGIDDFGNVYIVGSTEKSNGGKEFITIKYDNNGTEVWLKEFGSTIITEEAKAEKVAITSNGDVIVVGTIEKNGEKDFATIKYDTNGDRKFSKYFDAGNQNDEAKSITIKNDEIYVSGISEVGGVKQNSTVKYSFKEKPFNIVNSGTEIFNENELIIRFNRSQINTLAIDNREFVASNLSDFVNADGLSDLSQATEMNWDNFSTYKIHTRMTSADGVSISRSGLQVNVPAHWATLSVFIPPSFDIDLLIDNINNNANKILYAEKNYMSKLHGGANDTLFASNQESLMDTLLFPDAHINIDSAWDFNVGESYVKVGVFDHPVYWKHEDFGDGTYSGSNIKGGWDYLTDDSISLTLTPQNSSHGTSCAGIIGALRNNDKGIAGIAGGSVEDTISGVSLYSMGLSVPDTTLLDNASILCAIVEGSCSNPSTNFGFGLHIQNHSHGTQSYSSAYEEAVKTAWRNETLVVASRGNEGNEVFQYPACFPDDMVLNIGASGTDGKRANDIFNGDINFSSSYGGNIDLIAPGVTEIISAPYYINKPYIYPFCAVNLPEYTCFNGTSAAAPHAAGVAGLLMSQHNKINWYNNDLAPEDIEYLLENTAKERHTADYDVHSGWGLLNAGAAMKYVTGHYRVQHNSEATGFNQSQISTNDTINTIEMNGVPFGTYVANRFKVVKTYQETLGPNAQIIDHWQRPSSILSVGNTTFLVNEYTLGSYAAALSGNTMNVTATMYCYYIPSLDKWIPEEPANLKASFSMLVYDTDWTDIESVEDESFIFNIFPNPAQDIVQIEFELSNRQNIDIAIYNNLGQSVYQNKLINSQKERVLIDVSTLSKGIYFVKLNTENAFQLKKLIIE